MRNLSKNQITWMIVLIILSFLLGKNYGEINVINRAQELYHQDKLQYSSSDINYVATGTKLNK